MNQRVTTENEKCNDEVRPTELTAAQRAFAKVVGRLLAEDWQIAAQADRANSATQQQPKMNRSGSD